MNVLLTDILACPRCGGDFGLILFAAETVDRRVQEGELGCPNCRDEFPVRSGFADLRAPPRHPLESAEDEGLPDRAPLAIAAGMGVAEGPGAVVLIGPAAEASGAVARMVSGIEVLAVSPAALSWGSEPGVSRLVAWPGLPLRSGRIRGVALAGLDWPEWGDEVKRVLVPGGRVVLLAPFPPRPSWMEDDGLRLLASESDVAVVTAA